MHTFARMYLRTFYQKSMYYCLKKLNPTAKNKNKKIK